MTKVTFTSLDNEGNQIGSVTVVDTCNCPHQILIASHYRDNGTCKCDDPNDPDMAEREYEWDDNLKQWI